MRAGTALARMFETANFKLVRKNGHNIWACPCGHTQVTSPATPGGGRGASNARAQIKRTLRICNQTTRSTA